MKPGHSLVDVLTEWAERSLVGGFVPLGIANSLDTLQAFVVGFEDGVDATGGSDERWMLFKNWVVEKGFVLAPAESITSVIGQTAKEAPLALLGKWLLDFSAQESRSAVTKPL